VRDDADRELARQRRRRAGLEGVGEPRVELRPQRRREVVVHRVAQQLVVETEAARPLRRSPCALEPPEGLEHLEPRHAARLREQVGVELDALDRAEVEHRPVGRRDGRESRAQEVAQGARRAHARQRARAERGPRRPAREQPAPLEVAQHLHDEQRHAVGARGDDVGEARAHHRVADPRRDERAHRGGVEAAEVDAVGGGQQRQRHDRGRVRAGPRGHDEQQPVRLRRAREHGHAAQCVGRRVMEVLDDPQHRAVVRQRPEEAAGEQARRRRRERLAARGHRSSAEVRRVGRGDRQRHVEPPRGSASGRLGIALASASGQARRAPARRELRPQHEGPALVAVCTTSSTSRDLPTPVSPRRRHAAAALHGLPPRREQRVALAVAPHEARRRRDERAARPQRPSALRPPRRDLAPPRARARARRPTGTGPPAASRGASRRPPRGSR
jgi:hypothetical protein